MKVEIKKTSDIEEITVEILCKAVNEDILKLDRHIRLFSQTLVAKSAGTLIQIPAAEVYYIESVDRRTFVYTKDTELETDFRLYELEERLADYSFIRTSKSTIINLQKVSVLVPEINRMMSATMENGEKVCISRQYTKQLKAILSETRANRRAGQ